MTAPSQDAARKRRAERLRDTRRALIVEAARAVFDRAGLDGATLRVIAREAGCTTGAIYPYFDGKEAIYAAVLGESLQQLASRIVAAVDSAETSVSAAASGVLAFYNYYAERPADLTLGLYLLDQNPPKRLGAELDQSLNRQLQAALEPIERALAKAERKNPGALLMRLIAQTVGLLILDRTGRLRLWKQSGRALLQDALGDVLGDAPGDDGAAAPPP